MRNLLARIAGRAVERPTPVIVAAVRAQTQGLPASAQRQAALAAGQQILVQFQQQLENLAVQYGQSGPPRLNDPRYVESVICDSTLPGCQPKARLAAITPSADSALISIRLRPGLSDAEREKAITLFRQAVADPTFQLKRGGPAFGPTLPSYVVSGVPVVFDGL